MTVRLLSSLQVSYNPTFSSCESTGLVYLYLYTVSSLFFPESYLIQRLSCAKSEGRLIKIPLANKNGCSKFWNADYIWNWIEICASTHDVSTSPKLWLLPAQRLLLLSASTPVPWCLVLYVGKYFSLGLKALLPLDSHLHQVLAKPELTHLDDHSHRIQHQHLRRAWSL